MTLNIPHAWLISDLHLDESRPALTRILIDFLRTTATRAPALFLLGDIFEAWVGDDDDQPLVARVADALHAVAASGTAVYFMHGNRDFLLGDAYARRAGMQLLDDPLRLNLGGVATVLSHGDALCTDDVAYQAFRAQSRSAAWQASILAMPLAERRALARQLRQQSVAAQHQMMADGMPLSDVNAQAVMTLMQAHGVSRLIHGHTHRPDHHRWVLPDGGPAERIVLSDWREHGEALEVHANGSLQRHPLRA